MSFAWRNSSLDPRDSSHTAAEGQNTSALSAPLRELTTFHRAFARKSISDHSAKQPRPRALSVANPSTEMTANDAADIM